MAEGTAIFTHGGWKNLEKKWGRARLKWGKQGADLITGTGKQRTKTLKTEKLEVQTGEAN